MEVVVKVGNVVNNFKAQAYMPNGEFECINLYDVLKDDRWVVLFFWPSDFTPVCSSEIESFSNNIKKFRREGVEVLGVSTDSINAHKAWCELDKEKGGLGKINFPLLEDRTHEISKYFGILDEKQGIALRGTFIISPEFILESSMINNINVGRSIDEVLRTLAAFQTGGLCGVDWHEGDVVLPN